MSQLLFHFTGKALHILRNSFCIPHYSHALPSPQTWYMCKVISPRPCAPICSLAHRGAWRWPDHAPVCIWVRKPFETLQRGRARQSPGESRKMQPDDREPGPEGQSPVQSCLHFGQRATSCTTPRILKAILTHLGNNTVGCKTLQKAS